MSKKNILVTGVSGFIGRYAARFFAKNGWAVTGVDMVVPENAPLSDLIAYYQVKLPSSDFNSILKKQTPDACIHCAGRASVGHSMSDPLNDFYESAVLTFEVLDAFRHFADQCKFILLSSAAILLIRKIRVNGRN